MTNAPMVETVSSIVEDKTGVSITDEMKKDPNLLMREVGKAIEAMPQDD